MANPYFDPGVKRAEKVNALFTRIAPRYDLINDLQSFGLHRVWKRKLVQMAEVGLGAAALDVCCGTGDIVYGLAGTGARGVGLDFSQRMLDCAQLKNRRGQSDNPGFLRGDAQRLPFGDNAFDAVTVGYGLRNLAQWEVGLREMVRVAKPGGRILVLEFGKPANRIWRGLYFAYLKVLVPVFGWLFAGSADAYSYIFESLQHYPAQQGVASKMRELGLNPVGIHHFIGGVMTINSGRK